MDPSRYSSPPPMSLSRLVVGFYGGLALTALLISAGREDVDIYRIDGVSTSLRLGLSPLLGVLLGLGVVKLSRLAVQRFDWARLLHRDFQAMLGPLTRKEVMLLAVCSAIGEELLFRGALQPWIGIWPQALVFALLHVGPRRYYLWWTGWSVAIGLAFGYMYQWTGDLGGPIAAHFVINYLNLQFIVTNEVPDTAEPGLTGREPLSR